MRPPRAIHAVIKVLREGKGYNQTYLAGLCRVHKTAVAHWELGDSAPQLSNLKTLAKIFDVPLLGLLEAMSWPS
jgi:transcriptional regulator with XRE-family HTH domain